MSRTAISRHADVDITTRHHRDLPHNQEESNPVRYFFGSFRWIRQSAVRAQTPVRTWWWDRDEVQGRQVLHLGPGLQWMAGGSLALELISPPTPSYFVFGSSHLLFGGRLDYHTSDCQQHENGDYVSESSHRISLTVDQTTRGARVAFQIKRIRSWAPTSRCTDLPASVLPRSPVAIDRRSSDRPSVRAFAATDVLRPQCHSARLQLEGTDVWLTPADNEAGKKTAAPESTLRH